MPCDDVEERTDAPSLSEEEGLETQLEQVLLQLHRRARGVGRSVIADSKGLTRAGDIRGGMLVAVRNYVKQTLGTKVGSHDQLRYPSPQSSSSAGST